MSKSKIEWLKNFQVARMSEYLTMGEIEYLKIHSEYWLLKKHCKTAGDILIKVKRSIDVKNKK